MSELLTEAMFERKVGDYLERLRMAARMKHESHFTHYGPISINPKETEFRVRDLDGYAMEPVPRDGQSVETLVEQFDEKLEEAMGQL